MRSLRLLLVLALALTCVTTRAQEPRVTANTGAPLIDGTGRGPIADAVIVIDGARITQVGPRSAVRVPAGATVIDGAGKFVIRRLAEMHDPLLRRGAAVEIELGSRTVVRNVTRAHRTLKDGVASEPLDGVVTTGRGLPPGLGQ